MNNYSFLLNMIPKNTTKIVIYLLKNQELVNINQISNKLKISVGSTFKILKDLEKREIVKSQKLGNAIFYTLNLENEEAIKLCELLLIEIRRDLTGYAKIYSEDLRKFEDSSLIILFGSVLTNKTFNDVDVLVLTNNPKKINSFLSELSQIRSKPIIPLILTKEELILEIKNKKEPILEILRTGVVLKGESTLIEVICDAKN